MNLSAVIGKVRLDKCEQANTRLQQIRGGSDKLSVRQTFPAAKMTKSAANRVVAAVHDH